jgi:hypothetical protein
MHCFASFSQFLPEFYLVPTCKAKFGKWSKIIIPECEVSPEAFRKETLPHPFLCEPTQEGRLTLSVSDIT